jgi:hypothetical protein
VRGAGIVSETAISGWLAARTAASHPFILPRAPSEGSVPPRAKRWAPNSQTIVGLAQGRLKKAGAGCWPGEVKPTGVAKWLQQSTEFEVLLRMATHGADLCHEGDLPSGRFPNRVEPELFDEIDKQIKEEVAKGWMMPVADGPMAQVANAPIQAVVEPGKVRRMTDYSHYVDGERTGVNHSVNMARFGEPRVEEASWSWREVEIQSWRWWVWGGKECSQIDCHYYWIRPLQRQQGPPLEPLRIGHKASCALALRDV